MWGRVAIAAFFVVWAAAYSARSYSFWSAANPRTRLGLFPNAKKATEPFAGDIRRKRQGFLMLFAGSSMTVPLIPLLLHHGAHGFYVVAAVVLAGYVPSWATLAILALRHNRRVKLRRPDDVAHRPQPGRQSSEARRRPQPGRPVE
jgi:hypothetical protein